MFTDQCSIQKVLTAINDKRKSICMRSVLPSFLGFLPTTESITSVHDRGRGVLPYISHTGMCCWREYGLQAIWSGKGYGFQAIWSGIGSSNHRKLA